MTKKKKNERDLEPNLTSPFSRSSQSPLIINTSDFRIKGSSDHGPIEIRGVDDCGKKKKVMEKRGC